MILQGSVRGLKEEIVLIVPIVDDVFKAHGLTCVLTSGVRMKGSKSLHPYGYAADFDCTETITMETWKLIERDVRAALNDQYDVIAHNAGSGMHLHVEFDPR